jgi:hypothetical protein
MAIHHDLRGDVFKFFMDLYRPYIASFPFYLPQSPLSYVVRNDKTYHLEKIMECELYSRELLHSQAALRLAARSGSLESLDYLLKLKRAPLAKAQELLEMVSGPEGSLKEGIAGKVSGFLQAFISRRIPSDGRVAAMMTGPAMESLGKPVEGKAGEDTGETERQDRRESKRSRQEKRDRGDREEL